MYLVSITEIPEEDASVDSIIDLGDLVKYTSWFLTLGTTDSREMVSHSTSVESGEPGRKWVLLSRNHVIMDNNKLRLGREMS
jgi:hypothetical protein